MIKNIKTQNFCSFLIHFCEFPERLTKIQNLKFLNIMFRFKPLEPVLTMIMVKENGVARIVKRE